jgi:hypothetical protein
MPEKSGPRIQIISFILKPIFSLLRVKCWPYCLKVLDRTPGRISQFFPLCNRPLENALNVGIASEPFLSSPHPRLNFEVRSVLNNLTPKGNTCRLNFITSPTVIKQVIS